jgi:hypothetical protein
MNLCFALAACNQRQNNVKSLPTSFISRDSVIPRSKHTSTALRFDTLINQAHSAVTDLTDIFELHHVKQFNQIYSNPQMFKDSVIAYLSKPNSFEDKLIAVYSMTELPLNAYLDMLNSCYMLYSEKQISEELLNRFTFNEFDTNNTIIKQYQNPGVKVLFKEMMKSKSLSTQFKLNLKETLSGKRYIDLKNSGHL